MGTNWEVCNYYNKHFISKFNPKDRAKLNSLVKIYRQVGKHGNKF